MRKFMAFLSIITLLTVGAQAAELNPFGPIGTGEYFPSAADAYDAGYSVNEIERVERKLRQKQASSRATIQPPVRNESAAKRRPRDQANTFGPVGPAPAQYFKNEADARAAGWDEDQIGRAKRLMRLKRSKPRQERASPQRRNFSDSARGFEVETDAQAGSTAAAPAAPAPSSGGTGIAIGGPCGACDMVSTPGGGGGYVGTIGTPR